MPENVSLFVTGTPELVEGGTEGNAFQESHRELYERTLENRIALDRPVPEDFQESTRRIVELEEIALELPNRECSSAIADFDSVDGAVQAFLAERQLTFRGYLEFLENA